MKSTNYTINQKTINCLFGVSVNEIYAFASKENSIIITDEILYSLHATKWEGCRIIQIPSGEQHKIQSTVDHIINQLLDWQVNKDNFIIGIGGGVVTDIAGYVASVYKRGTKLGLVPTTILGMTDAAIGGKNGVNVALVKNMVGTIYQPDFILFDFSFLKTLPEQEWISGFAEIIKHACIKDEAMLTLLEHHTLEEFQNDDNMISDLIEKNVDIKFSIVVADEKENADRRLLNFGHTIGHAVENLCELPHGNAISIGIIAACHLSERINGFLSSDTKRIADLLNKYHLPTSIDVDHKKVFELLQSDKKREGASIHFVLLNKIGDAATKLLDIYMVENNLKEIL
ncbi:MAG: 3-dehydroquinate synthase [Bacteroidota bacterium]